MDRGELSVINYIEKYNALGERMQESDTLEVQEDMLSIFDGNSQHFTKKKLLSARILSLYMYKAIKPKEINMKLFCILR